MRGQIANEAHSAELAIYHLISNKGECNNCFIKSDLEILLDLADSPLQEQPEDNLMVSIFRISRAWYNGSYTMATKPIKSLELHYTMIQFLTIKNITGII